MMLPVCMCVENLHHHLQLLESVWMANSGASMASVCQLHLCVMVKQTVTTAVMKSPVRPPRVAPAPSGATMHSVCLDCGCAMEMPTVLTAPMNCLRNAAQGHLNLPKIPAPLWNSIAAVGNAYTVAGNAMGEKTAWIAQMRKTAVRNKTC